MQLCYQNLFSTAHPQRACSTSSPAPCRLNRRRQGVMPRVGTVADIEAPASSPVMQKNNLDHAPVEQPHHMPHATDTLQPAANIVLPPVQPEVGSLVHGVIVMSNARGARVKLLDYQGVTGYCPEYLYPTPYPLSRPDSSRRPSKQHSDHSAAQSAFPADSPQAPTGTSDHATEQASVGHASSSQTLPAARQLATAAGSTEQPASDHLASAEHMSATQPAAAGSDQTAKQRQRRHKKGKAGESGADALFPMGLRRSFVVVALAPGAAGPLLSAAAADLRALFDRLQQLAEAHLTLTAVVTEVNQGGCICTLQGMYGQAFLPNVELVNRHKRRPPSWEDKQALVGQELNVGIKEVDVRRQKVVVSERVVTQWQRAQTLELGQAFAGVITHVWQWGIDVQLEAVQGVTALVPWERVTRAEAVPHRTLLGRFEPGDKVVGLVCSPLPRLQLSLMELEEQDGDMLNRWERHRCWERAETYVTH